MMKKPAGNKKLYIIAGGCAAVLLLIYLIFSFYFMKHFYFKTTLNGMDISGCSVDEIKRRNESLVAEYELHILGRDGDEDLLKGKEINLRMNWDDSVQKLLSKQNGFNWIREVFRKTDLSSKPILLYDEEKLQERIKNLTCAKEENQIEPVDAGISSYMSGSGYSLVPAMYGKRVEPELLEKALSKAILTLTPEISLEEEGCYRKPFVLDDDRALLSALEIMNRYAGTVITYQVGEKTEVLDGEIISDWLALTENIEPVIDEEKVAEYVASLAKRYNTCYSIKRFTTTYGPTVTLDNNDYGWKVDQEAEQAAILEEIKAGKPVTRELNYSRTGNSHGENDYGDSYVEINLTAQHLFLYKEGKLIIETDVVTGNLARGNGTPTGINGVTYKELNATLRGQNYATPVKYWMPFNGNVGMHDANWRSAFGGSYYKTGGSNGCINMPPSAAKVVYENITQGYPVVVYELPGTESPLGLAQDAAAAVVAKITAIGVVTLESQPLITDARTDYDALSEMAKGFVSNYDTLVQAETDFAALQLQNGNTPGL